MEMSTSVADGFHGQANVSEAGCLQQRQHLHAARAGAVHELGGTQQEILGLEAGKSRVVPDEQAARIGQC